MQPVQNLRIGGRVEPRASISSSCRGSTGRSSTTGRSGSPTPWAATAAFTDVTSDLQNNCPAGDAQRRQGQGALARHHRPTQLRSTLYAGFGTAAGLDHLHDRRQLRGDRRVRPATSTGRPDALDAIACRAPNGKLVPLVAPSRGSSGRPGRSAVNQLGQLPAVTMSFNLPPGVALGDAVDRIEAIKAELGVPPTIATSFAGTAQVFQESLANQGLLLLAAVRDDLHRARHPLRELHPSADHPDRPAVGGGRRAGDAAAVRHGPERDRHHRHPDADRHRQEERDHDDRLRAGRASAQGAAPLEAIREACLLRFRPIMMTTLAAIMGALPIALGHGAGAELRQPLGVAVVGGLLVSQAADAVHHAGALSLHGGLGGCLCAGCSGGGPRVCRRAAA